MQSGEEPPASSEPRHDLHHERVTSRAKIDAVLRLLKGESVEAVSQDLGVTIRRIERWKSRFVEAGSAELSKRQDIASQGWVGRHSGSILQWIWLLLALVVVISVLVVLMQRGSPE
jgi:hypothetical protein